MKNVYGVPPGKVTPGCAERSGSPLVEPAAMLSTEPCTSMRTSWPRAL